MANRRKRNPKRITLHRCLMAVDGLDEDGKYITANHYENEYAATSIEGTRFVQFVRGTKITVALNKGAW